MRSLLLVSPLLISNHPVQACTSILVSCNASAHGYAMLAHAADCNDCDSRIALVPNRKHNSTELHAVRGMHHQFPREWSDRATVYFPPEGVPFDQPLGFIPEVNETYALWESVYGLMNEHGLTIGESSTYARINAPGVDLENPSTHTKGPAMFSIAMLIQIALERCTTAVCAVGTMGSISETYGFYAESFNAGESLSVVDTTGDGWIFHILPDPTGRSSIWCARRVPQGHVAALANQFTISTIDSNDTENYLHSPNMYQVAIDEGLWDGKSTFKFNRVFGTPGKLPMYISTRLWFIYNSVAPSLKLSPKVNPFDFPFSVPVDNKVSIEDIMAIYRSRYEGTEFDMTKGILAGPFGNPQRVDGGDGITQVGGQVTRPISIQRTAYTMIGVADPKNPLVLYASDAPTTSVFVPFLASTLRKASASNIEASRSLYSDRYQKGTKKEFDRYTAWWAFDFVANWMNINYRNMSAEYVYPAVAKWQPEMISVGASGNDTAIVEKTNELIDAWWKLADLLVVRYNDGYLNFPESSPDKVFNTGYPADFLREIGFDDGFVYPITVAPLSQCPMEKNGEDMIVFARQVNRTVEELHYLKDVILPRKFNKTIIVNISDPPNLPIVYDDVIVTRSERGGLETISAGQADEKHGRYGLVNQVVWMLVAGVTGYLLGTRKVHEGVSNDMYMRL